MLKVIVGFSIAFLFFACSSPVSPENSGSITVTVTATLPPATMAPTPTFTPAPTHTPVLTSTPQALSNMIYEHHKDRRPRGSDGVAGSRVCNDSDTNFSIVPPSKWVVRSSNCDYVKFGGKAASIEIFIEHLPDYDDDPDLVLKSLARSLRENGGSTNKITHHGQPAVIQQRLIKPNILEQKYHCVTKQDNLAVLSPSWSTSKIAFFVSASRCEDDTRHDLDLAKSMESFQMVVP